MTIRWYFTDYQGLLVAAMKLSMGATVTLTIV